MAEISMYAYEALDPKGKKKKGKLPAESRQAALETLQADGFVPISVEPFRRNMGNIDIIKPKEERPIKFKPAQEVVFARQLYLLVRAGLSLPKTLEAIGEDHPDVRYVRMCNSLSEQVLAGKPLSQAMEEFPGAFDEVFRAYVSAGEATGNLEEALYRLSRMLDRGNQVRLKVKGVTAYPKLVSMMIALMVTGILLFLVPTYANIYADFGAELPAPTKALLFLSSIMMPIRMSLSFGPPFINLAETGFWFQGGFPFLGESGWNILSSPINFFSPILWIAGGTIGWLRYKKSRADDLEFQARVDRVKFRIPLLGKLWMTTALYRWSATMAGALSAGLQMHETLGLAARSSGSKWIEYVTSDMQEAVQSGRLISKEMLRHPKLFNPQIRAMAVTGEESGEPAEMFDSVARTMEDELDAMVAVLGARIEVALLMIMAGVVGSLLVVLYLPILNLSTVASEGLSNPETPEIPNP